MEGPVGYRIKSRERFFFFILKEYGFDFSNFLIVFNTQFIINIFLKWILLSLLWQCSRMIKVFFIQTFCLCWIPLGTLAVYNSVMLHKNTHISSLWFWTKHNNKAKTSNKLIMHHSLESRHQTLAYNKLCSYPNHLLTKHLFWNQFRAGKAVGIRQP